MSNSQQVHASRQAQVPGAAIPASTDNSNEQRRAKRRSRKSKPTYTSAKAKPYSLTPVKRRIRDVRRQLTRRAEQLPADVKVDNERALAAHLLELERVRAEQLRQKMIRRYHKIRFFERRKATRRLKQLEKQRSSTMTEHERLELEDRIHNAEVDLNYTLYFPLDQKYIALYAGEKGTAEDEDDGEADLEGIQEKDAPQRPPLWSEVERAMVNGTLETLREGKTSSRLGIGVGSGAKAVKPRSKLALEKEEKSKSKSKTNGKREPSKVKPVKGDEQHDKIMDEAEDGESDGGFFEE